MVTAFPPPALCPCPLLRGPREPFRSVESELGWKACVGELLWNQEAGTACAVAAGGAQERDER